MFFCFLPPFLARAQENRVSPFHLEAEGRGGGVRWGVVPPVAVCSLPQSCTAQGFSLGTAPVSPQVPLSVEKGRQEDADGLWAAVCAGPGAATLLPSPRSGVAPSQVDSAGCL